MRRKVIAGIAVLLCFPVMATAATVPATSCSQAHVAAAIVSAVDGDTVTIPAGSCTWTSGVTVNEAIAVVGDGGGKVEGSSISSVEIGTGTKSFTLRSGSVIVGFAIGQTVRARVKYVPSYMEGTVTAWDSGTSVLELDVASVSGSGTHAQWTFQTPGTTQITHSASTNALFSLTESSIGNIDLSGIQFIRGTGSGQYVKVNAGASGQPVIVHDLMVHAGPSGNLAVDVAVNRGLFYRLFIHASFNWDALNNNIDTSPGPRIILPLSDTASWGSVSTMGDADPTGQSNVYFEDSYFVGMTTEGFDLSEAARVVIRHCIFDNTAIATHGPDTGTIGLRHAEIYDNTLIFSGSSTDNGDGDGTVPGMDYFFFVRGGTFVFTDNAIDNINSVDWGNKAEIKLVIENLRRDAGPFACWDAGYPAPRQVGLGYVTGLSGSGTGGYFGDSEPAYIWNTTGTATVTVVNYSPDGCGGGDDISDYIQASRDYFTSAKTGYAKYESPHPLRAAGAEPLASGSPRQRMRRPE